MLNGMESTVKNMNTQKQKMDAQSSTIEGFASSAASVPPTPVTTMVPLSDQKIRPPPKKKRPSSKSIKSASSREDLTSKPDELRLQVILQVILLMESL